MNLIPSTPASWKEPSKLNLRNGEDKKLLQQLIDSQEINEVIDPIEESITELYHIKFPSEIDSIDQQNFTRFQRNLIQESSDGYGIWAHFSWSKKLVHFPTKQHWHVLRTSRNRNLVTEEEQNILFNSTVLILGLSVGSSVVESLLAQGIGGKYILVDLDTLSPSNLNRIRVPYDQIGVHKVDVIAKKVSEFDPYIEQVHFREGLNEKNLAEIIAQHRPSVVIDEMDNLKMKLLLRQKAKEHQIPVLMATDDGDNVLLDIERFDQNPNAPVLHGKLPQEIIDSVLNGEKLPREKAGMIIGEYFVGWENVPPRMVASLKEVGKTLPSWPQLGGAAEYAGVTSAYCVKKILLNESLDSGRFLIGPDIQLAKANNQI